MRQIDLVVRRKSEASFRLRRDDILRLPTRPENLEHQLLGVGQPGAVAAPHDRLVTDCSKRLPHALPYFFVPHRVVCAHPLRTLSLASPGFSACARVTAWLIFAIVSALTPSPRSQVACANSPSTNDCKTG